MLAKTLQDLFKRYRRPGDIVFAIVFLAFAFFLFTQLGDQVKVTKRTEWFAQPGLWPTIAVYGMLFFGVLHFLSSLLSPRIPGRWREVVFWLRSLEFVGYFIIYVWLVPWLGYLPSTVLFTVFLMLRCEARNRHSVVVAVLFSVFVVLLFRGFRKNTCRSIVRIPAGHHSRFCTELSVRP